MDSYELTGMAQGRVQERVHGTEPILQGQANSLSSKSQLVPMSNTSFMTPGFSWLCLA